MKTLKDIQNAQYQNLVNEFGAIPEPVATNYYEEKQEARKDYYEDRSDRAMAESNMNYDRSTEMANSIPLGQPILVGHYSERRDRKYREGIHRAMEKSIEADRKAQYYASKAQSVGKGGISSDDPDAIRKLMLQLYECMVRQEVMKAANRIARSKKNEQQKEEALKALNVSVSILIPDRLYGVGFPGYSLANNNGNIKRIKERIKELKEKEGMEYQEFTIADYTQVEINPDDNRIYLYNDAKPLGEVTALYKRHGFKWSRNEQRWSRQLTNNALYALKQIQNQLAEIV